MVIAPEQFRDEEYAEPKRVLTARGASVVTASALPQTCVGKLGMQVQAEAGLADVVRETWDAAIFVGGGGAARFFDDENAHWLARETYAHGGVVGAICIAPSVLARAGLLDGVAATAFHAQRDDLVAAGALWSDQPVVISGRIVTGNGPEAAEEFGEAIGDVLGLPSR